MSLPKMKASLDCLMSKRVQYCTIRRTMCRFCLKSNGVESCFILGIGHPCDLSIVEEDLKNE